MKDKVTVIITTYKGSGVVRNAVLSVLEQTYKNIEIIVVDDNGIETDEQIATQNELQDFIDKKRIIYYRHKSNMNGSAARNTGARMAKGRWLSFLDDDDIYLPTKIAEEVKMAKTKNACVVVCGGYFIKRNGRGYETRFKNKGQLLENLLTGKTLFNTSTLLIDKNCFDKMGGFDESFSRHQDWEFFTRLNYKYGIVVKDKTLIVKYEFGRNIPSKPDINEEYLNIFMKKRGAIIRRDDKTIYERIRKYQLSRIAYYYHYSRDKKNFLRVMKMADVTHPYVKLYLFLLKHFINKMAHGSRKKYYSYDEIKDKLSSNYGINA